MKNFPPLKLQVFKNDKKIINRESHSYTRNHYLCFWSAAVSMECLTATHVDLYVVDTSGTVRQTGAANAIENSGSTNVLGGAGITTIGIVVGSDNTAETWNDYALGAQIAHGVGAGQLQYAAMNQPGFSGNKILTYTRAFTNASGGSVTVKEIGYIQTLTVGLVNRSILRMRDVLDSAVTLNDGEVLTVNYIYTLTYF